MNKFGSLYIEGSSFFHRMNPSIKLLMFLCWLVAVFMFLDLRISILLLGVGLIMLKFAEIPFRTCKKLFLAVIIFNLINAFFILLLAPDFGVSLSSNKDVVATILGFKIYYATLMYILVISLKYLSLLPLTLIFIFTTHPSKFACSLNKLGVPYKLAYTFNIIFRYFPEIQHEFKTIANAQAARGYSFGKDEKSLIKRVQNLFNLTIPLINMSLSRIDKITNAMDLRNFGKLNKRTWYNTIGFSIADIITLIVTIAAFACLLVFKIKFSQGLYIG